MAIAKPYDNNCEKLQQKKDTYVSFKGYPKLHLSTVSLTSKLLKQQEPVNRENQPYTEVREGI